MTEPLYTTCLNAIATVLADPAITPAPQHAWLLRRWRLFLDGHERGESADLAAAYSDLGFPPAMATLHQSALDRLPDLVRGTVTVQELLGDDLITAVGAYQDNPATAALNTELASFVSGGRVLELGGGAGHTTAAVLAAAPDADYLFTDVSRVFTSHARRRFPQVRVRELDINSDFGVGPFDVVVAGNVLHNARDIPSTLRRIHASLAPGGLLVFTEASRENPAVLTSMQFLLSGLTPTDRRAGTDEIFLNEAAWHEELAAAGFTLRHTSRAAFDQHLYCAVAAPVRLTPDAALSRLADHVPATWSEEGEFHLGPPDPGRALTFLERARGEQVVISGQLLRAVLAHPAAALADLAPRSVHYGGEPLSPEQVEAARDLFGTPAIHVRSAADREAANAPSVALAADTWSTSDREVLSGPAAHVRPAVDQGVLSGPAAHVRPAADQEALSAPAPHIPSSPDLHAVDLLDHAALLAMNDALRRGPHIAPRHASLVDRWRAALTKAGIPADAPPPDWPTVRAAWQAATGGTGTVDYAEANARALPDLLAGRVDPVQILFPEGSTHLAHALYRESPAARFQHATVAAFLKDTRPRSVLEIGAGTGATTEAAIPVLPDARYHVTDVSPLFLAHARSRWGHLPNVTYGRYDIDAPDGDLRHDAIVAGGVLNAARDTDAALRGLRERLTPGGWLVLTEPTREEHLVLCSQAFLMADTTDGRAADRSTFLTHAQWTAALADAGFDLRVDLPAAEHPLARLGHRVFIAKG